MPAWLAESRGQDQVSLRLLGQQGGTGAFTGTALGWDAPSQVWLCTKWSMRSLPRPSGFQ